MNPLPSPLSSLPSPLHASAGDRPRVVIVGAGIAGLAAAWWLGREGWRVRLVERAAHLRDGGHMMGLSGPGLATVRTMGLVPALKAVGYADMGVHVYRNRKGRVLLDVDYRELLSDLDWITLRRTELMKVLADDLEGDIRLDFGLSVATIENDAPPEADGIQLSLTDGSTDTADLVIAADGVHSDLRARCFGPDRDCLHGLGYRYAAYDIADSLHLAETFLSYSEPGLQSEYYTLASGRLAALHVWRSAVEGFVPPAARRGLLAEVTARSHPHVRQVLAAVDDDGDVVVDDLALVELGQWHRGRLLLLGDAAHSLSLISGQGAGLALASAAILVEELGRAAGSGRRPTTVQLGEAFAAHHRRLSPTVARLQQRSRRLAPAFVPATPFAFHLRNLAMRAMPRTLLKRYFLNGLKSEAEATAALR